MAGQLAAESTTIQGNSGTVLVAFSETFAAV
jgi:hypothetical protein